MKKGTVGVLSLITGGITGGITSALGVWRVYDEKLQEKTQKISKFKTYYNILNQWLVLKQEGQSLEKYFIDNGYHTLAIYGMGEMGERLYEELKDSSIEVKYAIDKNSSGAYTDLKVCNLEEELEKVDVVVVTATFDFDSILDELEDKIDGPIISLVDVVYEV